MRDGVPDCASIDAAWRDTLPKVMPLQSVMPSRAAQRSPPSPACGCGQGV